MVWITEVFLGMSLMVVRDYADHIVNSSSCFRTKCSTLSTVYSNTRPTTTTHFKSTPTLVSTQNISTTSNSSDDVSVSVSSIDVSLMPTSSSLSTR